MNTNEAAARMIGGAVGVDGDGMCWRWHETRFQYWAGGEWNSFTKLPGDKGDWTIEHPEPPGRVVRVAVRPGEAVTVGNFHIVTHFGSLLLSQLPDYPEHVVGYVYTLPDGTEHTLRTLGAVWCWPAKGNWPWFYSPLPMDGERPDARLAKLTHVLWLTESKP